MQETEANDFEDDMEPEFNTDKVNIESLLEQLDGEDSNGLSQNNEQPTPQTLDSVIDILQSVGIQQLSSPILNGVERVPIKSSKFMGMGTRQLQLDAGQKKFGIVDCKECGLHYNVSLISACKCKNE